jgi:microsomal dipeptidase-like Zn-dependent dipeptidase
MQAYIDAKAGGTGKGWFRIVTSAAEARRVMDQGKLAVVLGVEVDNPLGCGYVRKPKCFAKVGVPPTECVYPNPAEIPLTCNPATVTQRLDAWYRRGVRHLFPVHFADNAFAGTAKQNGMQWLVDRQAGDDWWGVAWVPAVPPSILPVEEYAIQVASCEASSGHASYGGKCNVRGLSGLGQHLVVQMMRRGMIIDIDHMGSRAKAAVFQLAKQYGYPGLVSGHSGFIATSLGDHRHEGQLSDAELKQLRAIGGLVGLILHQGKSVHDAPTWTGGNVRIPHRCGNSIETFAQAYLYATQSGDPVAFGTDYNGMIPPFGPRLGPERCRGGENASQPVNVRSTQPMPYPFVARGTGLTMNKSTAGNRTFDIATDGPAHMGMLPDLINDLEWIGVPPDRLEPLFNSAEAYVQLWERSETVGRTIP